MKMIDLKEDKSNLTINKIWNFQKEIERNFKNSKAEISKLTTTVKIVKTESQDQIIQKDNRSELKKIKLSKFCIHNKFKYKTGIAIIKENNRLIRVPVIHIYIIKEQEDGAGNITFSQWMKPFTLKTSPWEIRLS